MYSENLQKLMAGINKTKQEYKILTREEELELIEKYREKDPQHLKYLLICHNIYLAISFCKPYCNTSADYDSLIQDAFYGLAVAADKFDYDAGVKFSRYAYIWIKKYALSSYYERYNRYIRNNSVSLDMTVAPDHGNNDTDIILRDIFDLETQAETSEYDKYLSCSSTANECEKLDVDNKYTEYYTDALHIVETSANISTEDKHIFKAIYVNGYSIKQIADSLDKSVQMIRYKKIKVLEYLKTAMSKKYNATSFACLA